MSDAGPPQGANSAPVGGSAAAKPQAWGDHISDISDAADLTETARESLLRDLLPALPPDLRYSARMIANAMAIAAREHRLGAAAASNEAARLARLLADIDREDAQNARAPDRRDLQELRRSVCDAIRAGAFDGTERAAALVTALAETAHERVAISNPKALRDDAIDAARGRRAGEV
jgi:hypothetical protein